MKQLSFLLLATAFLLQGCLQDVCDATRTFVQYNPIYKQVDEIRLDIRATEARPLKNPGKIYYYNDFIFINELKEGVHIVDNSNPETPNRIAFIQIPGNVDIAVRGDILYADNYIDLISIDISSPKQPKLVDRQEEVFSTFSLHEDLGYLIEYEESLETIEINCDNPRFNNGGFFWRDDVLFAEDRAAFSQATNQSSNNSSSNTGVGGSLARFGIYQDFLYVIDQWRLKVFDIAKADRPNGINTVDVGWGIETIFPYKDKLFIGAVDGLYIFDNSTPTRPEQLSKFTHARACDPVVVNDNTAYVTLRGGTICDGFNNQLDIVDITDLEAPELIATHPMDNPHGLALKGETVFICDGVHGLKSFDVSDPLAIELLDHERIPTYDAIVLPVDNLLMVIGENGFYQYDVSDPSDLKEVSFMPVEQ